MFMDHGLFRSGMLVLKGTRLFETKGLAQGRALLEIHAKGWPDPEWRELCHPPPLPAPDWKAELDYDYELEGGYESGSWGCSDADRWLRGGEI